MTILMTSASELFHNRRSYRVGRGSPDLYSDRTSHRRHHCNYHVYHLHHHHPDSQPSDPLRRSLHVRPHLVFLFILKNFNFTLLLFNTWNCLRFYWFWYIIVYTILLIFIFKFVEVVALNTWNWIYLEI